MKKATAILAALALSSGFAVAADEIVIKGSDTLGAKMVPQLKDAYVAAGNDVSMDIAAEGSSTAFTALLDGSAEIGMSSRDVKSEEVDKFTAAGMKLKEWTAAYDMIGIIVNENNPLEDITLEQVEGIFTGDITDWSQVGGQPGEISAYTRNTSSGTYKSFQEMAMNKRDYGSNTQKMAGNEQIAEEVSKNPNGIGYVGLAYTTNPGIKTLKVDGVELKPKNAKKYPISRSLYYFTIEGKLSDASEKFLKWATKDKAAMKIVDEVGFIPAK